MNGQALIASAAVAAAARSGTYLYAGVIATDTADTQSILTQGGIFSIAIAIGYFMLRRGDTREKEQNQAAQAALTALNVKAQADLQAMRDEMAILRAELLTTRDKLIDALVRDAERSREMVTLTNQLAEVRAEFAEYRSAPRR